jgi:hypothetical protein
MSGSIPFTPPTPAPGVQTPSSSRQQRMSLGGAPMDSGTQQILLSALTATQNIVQGHREAIASNDRAVESFAGLGKNVGQVIERCLGDGGIGDL